MKMKITLLTALSFLFFNHLAAQEIYSEDFTSYTVGNIGTDTNGKAAGQGGWYTQSQHTTSGHENNNSLFQIQNTPAQGNFITIEVESPLFYGQAMKRDIDSTINQRSVGNDVIKFEVDFYTAQPDNSTAPVGNTISFGLSKKRSLYISSDDDSGFIAGFVFNMDTGELRGAHDDRPNSLAYETKLGYNNQPLILPFNRWVHCVVYADYINSKVVYEIPGMASVEADFFKTQTYPFNLNNQVPGEILVSTVTAFVDATYKFDNFKVTAVNKVLSTKEVLANSFNLYPNPATDFVTITTNDNIEVNQIKVYDLTGKFIARQDFKNEENIRLNVEKFASGTYLLHLQTDKGLAVKKLIKK